MAWLMVAPINPLGGQSGEVGGRIGAGVCHAILNLHRINSIYYVHNLLHWPMVQLSLHVCQILYFQLLFCRRSKQCNSNSKQ